MQEVIDYHVDRGACARPEARNRNNWWEGTSIS